VGGEATLEALKGSVQVRGLAGNGTTKSDTGNAHPVLSTIRSLLAGSDLHLLKMRDVLAYIIQQHGSIDDVQAVRGWIAEEIQARWLLAPLPK